MNKTITQALDFVFGAAEEMQCAGHPLTIEDNRQYVRDVRGEIEATLALLPEGVRAALALKLRLCEEIRKELIETAIRDTNNHEARA